MIEMCAKICSVGQQLPVLRVDNLTTFMCCLEILVPSTFWSPKGLYSPVYELMYLITLNSFAGLSL